MKTIEFTNLTNNTARSVLQLVSMPENSYHVVVGRERVGIVVKVLEPATDPIWYAQGVMDAEGRLRCFTQRKDAAAALLALRNGDES